MPKVILIVNNRIVNIFHSLHPVLKQLVCTLSIIIVFVNFLGK